MKHIVSVSGGLGSAEALRRTIETHGRENTIAVFADVKGDAGGNWWTIAPVVDALLHERWGGESRDTYRFIWQLASHFDLPIERLEDGRTVFQVFAKTRAFRLFSGGRFVHKCSELLKRDVIRRWLLDTQQSGGYALVLGMGWDEVHRVKSAQAYWQNALDWPVQVVAPNAEPPYADNTETVRWLESAGIDIPDAYRAGFAHNNCGGGCIAAGQAHWAQLYKTRPEVYHYWSYMEQSLQRHIGKDVSILKDERNGQTKPMTLAAFAKRVSIGDYPRLDYGGCGCFVEQQLSLAI